MFKKLLIAAMFALAACSGPAPAYAAIETMTPRMIVEAQNPQCLSPYEGAFSVEVNSVQ